LQSRIAGAVGLSLALAACATPTDMQTAAEPGFAIPPSWVADPAPVTLDTVQYWTLLGDPLITELVGLAITENRDLAIAAARLAQARAGVRQARAGYLPRLDGSVGVRRDFGDFADDDLGFSIGADAQWEIDLFGRIGYNVAISRGELAAAGYALSDVQRLIVGQVAQIAVSARGSAVRLAIARETLAIQDDNLQIAVWRREAGLVSSLDVEQARAQQAQTAAIIPALEAELAAASYALSTLIGEPPGRVLTLFEAQARAIPVPPASVGFEAPAEVLRRRPDVRQAEALLIADSARIGLTRTQLLPLVQLTGSIGTGSIGFDGLFDTITGGLFAGIGQLIFDGGRTRAQIDAAEAAASASLANWERTILLALEEVEGAAADLRAARARVALFAVALEAGENAALLARSQYETGLIDFQTLLLTENQLLSARNSLAASEVERAAAFVRLTQALGGGWDGEPDDTDEGTPR
jgi:NodT family efflux transporter outer membrane factor (OMF) lipoprotein